MWQYGRDEPAVNAANDYIIDFNTASATNNSLKFEEKITSKTGNDCVKSEIMVPLKFLSNFPKTLEMLLINCEINLILTWSEKCIIVCTTVANQGPTFSITDTKLYVLVVILSNRDNTKLLRQLEPRFKRRINWNN